MRVISQAGLDALASGRIIKRTLVRAETGSGVFAVWDDVGTISYGGETYHGAAGRFHVSALPSVEGLGVQGATVTFSGLDSVVAADMEGAIYHQRPVQIILAVFSAADRSLVFARPWFSGVIDTLRRVETGGGQSTVTVSCETLSRELGRRGTRTRSDADQQSDWSGDKFFEHVAAAVTEQVYWGRKGKTKIGSAGGGSGASAIGSI
jgi:hypothetical protein